MRIWYDIEQDTIVTEAQLYDEYCTARESDPDNEAGHRDLTFEEYTRICQTIENGTLEALK